VNENKWCRIYQWPERGNEVTEHLNFASKYGVTVNLRAFSGTVGTSLADSQRFLSPTNQPIAQHNSGFHGKQKGIPTATESY